MKYLITTIIALAILIPFAHPANAVRLWSSGFELASSSDQMETNHAAGNTGVIDISTSVVRSGADALYIKSATSSWDVVWHQFTANSTAGFAARVAIYVSSTPASLTSILTLEASDGTPIFGLSLTDSVLQLVDEDSATGFGATTTITTKKWELLELLWDFSGAGATDIIRAKLNGVEFASSTSRNLSSGVAQIVFGNDTGQTPNPKFEAYYDDAGVNNTSTSAFNTTQTSWLGDGHIVHMMPNATGTLNMGAASTTGAVCGTWDCVNERLPNDNANYYWLDANADILNVEVEGTASSSVNIQQNSATNSTTIKVVQVGVRERPATAAADGFKVQLISSSTSALYVHSSTAAVTHNDVTWRTNGDAVPRNYSVGAEVDPNTNAEWTLSALDAMRIGLICSDAAPDCYISTLWSLVEYTTSSISVVSPEVPVPPTPTSTKSLLKGGSFTIKGSTIFR